MKLSILQLNANSDNYWDKLIPYLKANDFDILHLQELTGNNTTVADIHSHHNTYAELQKILEEKYYGVLSVTQRYQSSPDAYLGNATFYKKNFFLQEKNEIVLSQFDAFPAGSTDFSKVGRTFIHLSFEIDGTYISFINVHAAWGTNNIEKPYQTEQGKILVDYLKTVPHPFVLSGDFNLTPEQPLITKIDALARNLTTENKITNTLNPKNHRVKHLFPKGLAVDYIFTSRDIIVKNFEVVDEGLSDHFGLVAEIVI